MCRLECRATGAPRQTHPAHGVPSPQPGARSIVRRRPPAYPYLRAPRARAIAGLVAHHTGARSEADSGPLAEFTAFHGVVSALKGARRTPTCLGALRTAAAASTARSKLIEAGHRRERFVRNPIRWIRVRVSGPGKLRSDSEPKPS